MSSASEEIEQTLKLERDALERRIARVRVWFFTVIMISGVPMNVLGELKGKPTTLWVSLSFFGTVVALAWLIQRVVLRHGAVEWLMMTTVVFDLSAMLAPGVVFPAFDPGLRDNIALFASHLTPTGALLVLFVNSLRNHTRVAIFGAVVAMVLEAVILIRAEGVQPPLAGVLLGTGFTAVIGWMGARGARHTLERFARSQLLRRYLPAGAYQRVMSENPDAAMALGGKQVFVTLLTSDLRGFTALSEKLAPEEVVRQLNAYHSRMVAQLDAHGGVLDKFMGDGILAVFGLEVPGQSVSTDAGAAAAVRCAKGMLAALAQLNTERTAEGLPPLAVGIGVHSGPVVAGNIGAPGRLEFTVIGDTVNTAARLEGLTKEAGRPLLISKATVDRLGSLDVLEALPAMAVRGRAEALQVYGVRA